MAPAKRRSGSRAGRHVVVLITASSAEEGGKIGHALVSEHLAACVNVVPSVRSIYFWEERVCDEPEVLLVCKTRASLVDRLSARVRELHSYTVPEIIALPVVRGSEAYLAWVDRVTRPT